MEHRPFILLLTLTANLQKKSVQFVNRMKGLKKKGIEMKIKNKTVWDTKSLRRLFSLCVKWMVKCGEKRINKGLVVEMVYGGYSGQGSFYRKWMLIRVPNPKRPSWVDRTGGLPLIRLNTLQVAEIFCHEYCHNLGYRHGGELRRCSTPEDFYLGDMAKHFGFKWEEFEIPKRSVKVKPKIDLQLKRYQHVLKVVEKKTKQLKRIHGQLKKWVAKRKRYERVLVAAGKIDNNDKTKRG